MRAKGCRPGCGKEGITNSIVTVDNKYYYLCYFTCNNFGGFPTGHYMCKPKKLHKKTTKQAF